MAGKKPKYDFAAMEIGDWFPVMTEAEVLRVRSAANQHRMQYGRKFTVQRVPRTQHWACERVE